MPARIRVPHRFSQPEIGLVRDFPSNFSCDMIFASQGIVPTIIKHFVFYGSE